MVVAVEQALEHGSPHSYHIWVFDSNGSCSRTSIRTGTAGQPFQHTEIPMVVAVEQALEQCM